MAMVLVSGPTVEPLTLEEAKTFLKVQHDLENADISGLIAEAREDAELHSGRQLLTATWRLILDAFPAGDAGIKVPRPKLQSVSAITYVDTAGTTQTLDAADYSVDGDTEPGFIVPAYGEIWPTARDQINAVKITFVCGYGTAADVPKGLKELMKAQVALKYMDRVGGWNLEAIHNGYRKYWHGCLDVHT